MSTQQPAEEQHEAGVEEAQIAAGLQGYRPDVISANSANGSVEYKCPLCGGSGRIDNVSDVRPAPQQEMGQ